MKKIFLLDDNIEFAEITRILLGKEYELRSSATTENIVEELSNFEPDLILIDHFIGNSDSESVLHSIKKKLPDFKVPFVLVSASHDVEERAKKLGAAGFIEKPSSINYIKEYIKKILS